MSTASRALNVTQVRSIRSRFNKGQTKTELAHQFGVSPRTIGRIVTGESYADVQQLPSKSKK